VNVHINALFRNLSRRRERHVHLYHDHLYNEQQSLRAQRPLRLFTSSGKRARCTATSVYSDQRSQQLAFPATNVHSNQRPQPAFTATSDHHFSTSTKHELFDLTFRMPPFRLHHQDIDFTRARQGVEQHAFPETFSEILVTLNSIESQLHRLYMITSRGGAARDLRDSLRALNDFTRAHQGVEQHTISEILVVLNPIQLQTPHRPLHEPDFLRILSAHSARKKKLMTLGWVVNGVRRHAEPQRDGDPSQPVQLWKAEEW
jgi:hypothetical protein